MNRHSATSTTGPTRHAERHDASAGLWSEQLPRLREAMRIVGTAGCAFSLWKVGRVTTDLASIIGTG